MRQIYSADSSLFWEEVDGQERDDGEGKAFILDCPSFMAPTAAVVDDFCCGAPPDCTVIVGSADTHPRDSNQNNCLSVCTFASRLVLNNLLPSRFANWNSTTVPCFYYPSLHGRFLFSFPFAWLIDSLVLPGMIFVCIGFITIIIKTIL